MRVQRDHELDARRATSSESSVALPAIPGGAQIRVSRYQDNHARLIASLIPAIALPPVPAGVQEAMGRHLDRRAGPVDLPVASLYVVSRCPLGIIAVRVVTQVPRALPRCASAFAV